jgi:hypothetical protein
MNIKSLLLGSAAALVAVSGARAADAIIAEPEPVEYVRVCDAYGAGFFYIPGTETCLSVSGYVWFQVGLTNAGTSGSYYGFVPAVGWNNETVRARVNFDARSDTELGTLRSYIRLQGTWAGNFDGAVTVDQAFIELGGFRVGYTESAWVTSQSVGVGQFGSHSWVGMSYGYQQRHLMSYTFAGNGFAATLSLENDFNANYIPDVVGVVSYNGGWGGVWGKLAYDESAAGWGGQLGVQLNVPNAPGSSLRVIGYYSSNAANVYAVGSRWSVLASYGHRVNAQLFASLQAQYFAQVGHIAGINAFQIEGEVVYTPVTNFEIRASVAYRKTTALTGSLGGFLRFTRSF